MVAMRSALALAAVLLAAVAAPAVASDTKTLMVDPVETKETAQSLEASANSWLQAKGWNGLVKVNHLPAVKIAIMNGLPSELADDLRSHLMSSFGTSNGGKARHFEWDQEVHVAGNDDGVV
mmetsp:Transcript_29864/g.67700  ORF Transcript_29864/g.67700 Transcript_29864/m.67700 type:complete len:121 (+) Transcript_29864:65-427(+)